MTRLSLAVTTSQAIRESPHCEDLQVVPLTLSPSQVCRTAVEWSGEAAVDEGRVRILQLPLRSFPCSLLRSRLARRMFRLLSLSPSRFVLFLPPACTMAATAPTQSVDVCTPNSSRELA